MGPNGADVAVVLVLVDVVVTCEVVDEVDNCAERELPQAARTSEDITTNGVFVRKVT